jgi:uncharacterized protein (DUF1501 family)
MKISRRVFLKSGGVAMIGMGAMPAFLQRAIANTAAPDKKKLVVLFQRGAMDGLNVVVPFAEPNYYRLRPTIAIPQPTSGGQEAAIDLDGFFGLHPSLQPFEQLFHSGQLAIVQAVGSPDPSRSHFDAQDFMESGTPGVRSTDDGWLNRSLQAMPEEKESAFRAVAFGPYLPLTLRGKASAIAIPDLKQFKVFGNPKVTEGGFEAMYAQTVDQALHGVGQETFEAVDSLKKLDPDNYQPANGAEYPKSRFGRSLQEIAELLKADLGMEVAFLDSGGWDNHVGTDHGHANCMFVMGGGVKGGKVYTKWPGLNDGQLHQDRDLAVTTDYRSVLGEILTKHLGNRDLSGVFPGFDNDPRKFLNILKS